MHVNIKLNQTLIKYKYELMVMKEFSTKNMCQKIDTLFVGLCKNKDYVHLNQQQIMQVDNLYLNAFTTPVTNTEYFPEYTKERKNILVELWQSSEINNVLFELFSNKQQDMLPHLAHIHPTSYV